MELNVTFGPEKKFVQHNQVTEKENELIRTSNMKEASRAKPMGLAHKTRTLGGEVEKRALEGRKDDSSLRLMHSNRVCEYVSWKSAQCMHNACTPHSFAYSIHSLHG